jgi:translation elongation factor EF-Ts
MEITASMVKELRERTGAGMMDCKRALVETDGDFDKAVTLLREKGLAAASKRAGRETAEGVVESYIHMGGRIGVLIEVNCETDFVAKTDQFRTLARDLAMQVAASRPLYVSRDEVPVLARPCTHLVPPNPRPNRLTHERPFYVPFGEQVEDNNRYPIVHAKRSCRGIHHAKLATDDINE